MTVLVAGAGGFIGGHFVNFLTTRGEDVRAVDIKPATEWHQLNSGAEIVPGCDLRSASPAIEVCRDVSQVYNFACDMGGMGFIENNKAACMLSVVINVNLLRGALEQGVSRYFFASSACVYAAARQTDAHVAPLKEEDAYPAMPEDGYGWEKLFGERMCRHVTEDYGLTTRVARFHNVYGPYGTFDGGREKAPAAICRKVIQAKLSGIPKIEIWGDGGQTRSFTWIDDCVDGIDRIMRSDIDVPINLGSSELVTINQLVDIVESSAGVSLERTYDLSAPKGVRGRNSDNTMILERLGWEPSTPLSEGIATTYEWITLQMSK